MTESCSAHNPYKEVMVDRGEELGDIEAQHGRNQALLPAGLDLRGEECDGVDGRFLPGAAELAGVENAKFVAVELESVVDGLLQPFGGTAEEDDWSECLEFGVIRLVGFGYDNGDCTAELFRP